MVLAVLGSGDLWSRFGLAFGLGAGHEVDRGAQLADGGREGEFAVVGIGAVGGVLGDHPDLIQRELAFPHAFRAAGEVVEALCDGDHDLGVAFGHARLPRHECVDGARPGHAGQFIPVDLGDDLDQPAVDGVALAHQFGDLTEQPLQPLFGFQRCCGGGHIPIVAPGSDKYGPWRRPVG